MSIRSELRKNLSRYPKIDEDVYDLGGCVAVLTPRRVYIGSDFYYESHLVGEKISSMVEGPWYKEKAKSAFESVSLSPLPQAGHDVIILRGKGRRYHRFLDEWKKVSHKSFLKELSQSL